MPPPPPPPRLLGACGLCPLIHPCLQLRHRLVASKLVGYSIVLMWDWTVTLWKAAPWQKKKKNHLTPPSARAKPHNQTQIFCYPSQLLETSGFVVWLGFFLEIKKKNTTKHQIVPKNRKQITSQLNVVFFFLLHSSVSPFSPPTPSPTPTYCGSQVACSQVWWPEASG